MAIAQSILGEFDHEMASTRKLLERVPDADKDWKPHPKSPTLGWLAAHVANLPTWTGITLTQTEIDVNPPGGTGYVAPVLTTTAELLRTFDANVKAAREAIAGTSDADFMVAWSLKNGGKTVFTLPRVAVMRSFVMNHLIHHRGQLTIYLRLRNVPLPSIYGPTADEPM